jgi:hypothetical protein
MCQGGSNSGSGSISSFIISLMAGLFVDLIPFLTMCIWPIVVDTAFGRCFLIALLVSPGNDVNQLLSIALQSVLTAFKLSPDILGRKKGSFFTGVYLLQKLVLLPPIETQYVSVQKHVSSYLFKRSESCFVWAAPSLV